MADAQCSHWTRPLPWLVALGHVASYAMLLLFIGNDPESFIFVLALSFAQISLIAIWGGAATQPAWLRMPAVVVGVFAIWFAFAEQLAILAADQGAATFLMFALQGLLIVIAVVLARVLGFVVRRRKAQATADDSRPLRYGLRTLILWTTMLAALFGVGRVMVDLLSWTNISLERDHWLFGPLLGGYNALFAILVVATLRRRNYWLLRALVGLVLAALVGLSLYLLATFISPEDDEMPLHLTAWGLGQAGILYATLLPLGWSLSGNRPAPAAGSQSAGELPGTAAAPASIDNELAAGP